MMCFTFYSIIRSVVKEPEDVEETIPIALKICFTLFIVLGYTFTAGMSAVLPM